MSKIYKIGAIDKFEEINLTPLIFKALMLLTSKQDIW